MKDLFEEFFDVLFELTDGMLEIIGGVASVLCFCAVAMIMLRIIVWMAGVIL